MAALFSVLLYLLVPVGYVIVPGAAMLSWLGFRASTKADVFLAGAAAGIAWTGCAVYVLLFAGLYTRVTASLILLIPSAWLAGTLLTRQYTHPIAPSPAPRPRRGPLDRAAIAAICVLIGVAFADAATSPITAWDADVSWDKWAADWGRRSDSHGYLVGAYPQLLPMFSSVLYKLTGAFDRPIPLEQFALHAMHPLFGSILLVAIVRLSAALGVAAWPALLVTFGNAALLGQLTSGAADLLLAAMTAASAALLGGYLRGSWTARGGPVAIAGAAFFAVAFTKANGLAWVLLPVVYALIRGVMSRAALSPAHLRQSGLVATTVVPLLLCAPFYLYQFLAAPPSSSGERTREVNYSARKLLPMLAHISDKATSGDTTAARVRTAAGTLVGSFDAPRRLAPLFGIVFLLLAVMAARRALGAAMLALLAANLAIWYQLAAYDARNMLNMLPIAGVLAAKGAAEWRQFHSWKYLRVAVAAVAAMFVVLASWTIAKGIARPALLLRGDRTLHTPIGARLAAMSAGPEEKIRLHFPTEYPVYAVLRRLPSTANAGSLLGVGHLYRWFPNGAYPLADWKRAWTGDDDLWVALKPNRPPRYEAWTLLHETPHFRMWIMEKDLRAVPLSEISTSAPDAAHVTVLAPAPSAGLGSGEGSQVLAYNLRDRRLAQGSYVIWRALVDAAVPAPGVTPALVASDPGIVDVARSTAAIDAERAAGGTIAYSGLVTFARAPSPDARGEVLAGIVVSGASAPIRLRSFEVSIHP